MAWEKPGVQTVIAETTARNIKGIVVLTALFPIVAICASGWPGFLAWIVGAACGAMAVKRCGDDALSMARWCAPLMMVA
jgi:nitrate reductase NapE component